MTITTIGQDPGLNTGGIKPSTGGGASTFALLADAAGVAGSTVSSSMLYAGDTTGAAISAAATNGSYSGLLAAGGSTVPTTMSPYATPGAYVTGGGGMGGPMYTHLGDGVPDGGGGLGGEVENILAETATSQAYLIGIQAQMGQQQSTFTAVSNALNVKYSMEKSAIQNFRA